MHGEGAQFSEEDVGRKGSEKWGQGGVPGNFRVTAVLDHL